MKEIPINDKALMVVTDNAISFHYKTSLLDNMTCEHQFTLSLVIFYLICCKKKLKSKHMDIIVLFVCLLIAIFLE